MKVMAWSYEQFDLVGTNNNYFLLVDHPLEIAELSFTMECGEVLLPGDDFHMAGTSGAAFNPGLHLSAGGLIYLGQVVTEGISEGPTTFVLFDWVDGEGVRPLPDVAKHMGKQIAYVAFTVINANEWMFTSSACAARLVKTNELRRGLILEEESQSMTYQPRLL